MRHSGYFPALAQKHVDVLAWGVRLRVARLVNLISMVVMTWPPSNTISGEVTIGQGLAISRSMLSFGVFETK